MATTTAEINPTAAIVRRRRSRLRKLAENQEMWRGIVALIVFISLWEVGARSKELFGY